MSFYSALVLAANEGVRVPSTQEIDGLFRKLGLVNAHAVDAIGNLADDIGRLFGDRAALAENDRFFQPDSILFDSGIHIEGPDGDYQGPGWCIGIHGNGYLFPWEIQTLRERVVRAPKLLALRQAIQEALGGRFSIPAADEAFLRERMIDGEGGWTWFITESL